MTGEDLVEKAYNVFSGFEKPEQCTTFDDLEDSEFDAELRNVSRRELTSEQVGTVAWGPIPSLSPEAIAYFMPRLIELAVTGALNSDGDPFLIHFVNAFSDEPSGGRYRLFEQKHRAVVGETFAFLCGHSRDVLHAEGWLDEAKNAAVCWLGG